MRYHWLAQYLVQVRYPQLDAQTRKRIVSEAVCRAWCTFLTLDYRLMLSCIEAAAQRSGITPAEDPAASTQSSTPAQPGSDLPHPHRAEVIRLSDYR